MRVCVHLLVGVLEGRLLGGSGLAPGLQHAKRGLLIGGIGLQKQIVIPTKFMVGIKNE